MKTIDFGLLHNDTTIPVPPTLKHLEEKNKPTKTQKKDGELQKYEQEYDAFCRWSSLPKEQRDPKTAAAFEKKWRIPKNYHTFFQNREDFQDRRHKYFYEWMFDLYPDVVLAMYNRALKNSSSDARTFSEIIAKRLEVNKPKQTIQPLMLIGVDQDKIDNLFIPAAYEKKVQEGEVVK